MSSGFDTTIYKENSIEHAHRNYFDIREIQDEELLQMKSIFQ